MVVEVPTHLLGDTWRYLEPHLARALEYDAYPHADGLLAAAHEQRVAIMAVTEDGRIVGAIAIEALKYPREMVGNVLAIGGETGSMARHEKEVLDFLESWCRKRNLVKMSMLGRQGWGRVLARQGWRVQPSVMAWKPL